MVMSKVSTHASVCSLDGVIYIETAIFEYFVGLGTILPPYSVNCEPR